MNTVTEAFKLSTKWRTPLEIPHQPQDTRVDVQPTSLVNQHKGEMNKLDNKLSIFTIKYTDF